jgi:hypothetical protein
MAPETPPNPDESRGRRPARRRADTSKSAAKEVVKAATPWGSATVVEEVRISQQVGDRRFASLLQLLEDDRGGFLIRIAYTTDGVVRRGPVTLRPKDLARLRASVKSGSPLAAAFGWSGGEA